MKRGLQIVGTQAAWRNVVAMARPCLASDYKLLRRLAIPTTLSSRDLHPRQVALADPFSTIRWRNKFHSIAVYYFTARSISLKGKISTCPHRRYFRFIDLAFLYLFNRDSITLVGAT